MSYVAIYLRKRTTNFDETWHTFYKLTGDGFEVIWAHITHKQNNSAAKLATSDK